MKLVLFSAVIVLALVASQAKSVDRAISLFNVVTFKNDPCDSNEKLPTTTSENKQRQGNCLSSSECDDDNGSNSGSCASGFGVCCLFEKRSATDTTLTIDKNNTYVQNPGFPTAFSTPATTFTYNIKKKDDDICMIRIDFEKFEINQPADQVNGCATRDRLEITLSSGLNVPVICGDNTGQHMYLDLGEAHTDRGTATMVLTTVGTATMRMWDIKIAQIECNSKLLPPTGCLQYYTEPTGQMKTFNFDGGFHLIDQDYSMCVRRKPGFCCVEYQVCSGVTDPFQLLDDNMAAQAADCITAMDYIVIPGGSPTGDPASPAQHNKFCGEKLNSIDNSGESVPIRTCVSHTVSVVTDDSAPASGTSNNGVCLDFQQLPCM